MKETWKRPLYFFSLMALAFLFYGGFLNDFFFNDDYAWLLEAEHSSHNLVNIFTLNISNFFRPLVHLTFLVEYLLFGVKPLGYHIVATLWHGMNAILFYFVLHESLKVEDKLILFWAPVLWVTQSTYGEAVGWISALTNLILASAILITFIGLGKQKSWLFLTGFMCTLLTKEEGAFLFPLVILYLYLFRNHAWRKTLFSKEILFSGSIWLAYLVAQFLIQKSGPLVAEQTFQLDFKGVLRMAEKILALFGNLQPTINMILPTFVLLMIYGVSIGYNTKTSAPKALWFMLAWVIMALVPTSFLNFDSSATRYFYNASFASAFIITVLIFSFYKKTGPRKMLIYGLLIAWMGTHFLTIKSAGYVVEQQGKNGKNLVEAISKMSDIQQGTYNFINPPYAPPAIKALMKVYFDVPAEQVVFNQAEDVSYVNMVWE